MRPDSEELARRIDAMIAFQNGEAMQYLNKGMRTWIDMTTDGGLSFDWNKCDFRVKPKLREGYIFAKSLHQHSPDFRRTTGENTCFKVREVIEE